MITGFKKGADEGMPELSLLRYKKLYLYAILYPVLVCVRVCVYLCEHKILHFVCSQHLRALN
jgi:hypothetical protein